MVASTPTGGRVMLTFAYPWLLVLIVLPLFVRWLSPAHREPRRGLIVPFLKRLADLTGENLASGAVALSGNWLRSVSVWLMWGCVVVAMARPQIIEPPITKTVPVRDMLLAIDLSGSMETKDFTNSEGEKVDRLTAVKEVVDEFLTRREGDRVGLIFFGTAAFVQAPFTEDLNVCRQLLDEAQVRMAGPRTGFGDALGLAISVFESSDVEERVVIALTDGNDTGSKVPPTKAAEIARDRGIVIHTIAVGDPEAAGEEALDIESLEQVAKTTDGLYSFAANREELEATYQQLDALETREAETISHRPRTDIYWWPLAVGVVFTMFQHFIQLMIFSRKQARSTNSQDGAQTVFASFAPIGATTLFNFSIFPILDSSSGFHFLRPGWLLLLVPATLLVWWLNRAGDRAKPFRGVVADHLLPHLLSRDKEQRRIGPLALIAVCWFFGAIALSGPTWRQEPNPFAEDTAALAIVVRVSESMKTEDVQPDRLTRATQKISDLLSERRDGKTALIAYSGTAHVVMPPTTDGAIIDSFARSLDPSIMPEEGDVAAEALALAETTLAEAGGGFILWITDSVAPEEESALKEWRSKSALPVRLFPPLMEGPELDSLKEAAAPIGPDLVRLSADDSDVKELLSAAKFSTASTGELSVRWEDGGYWLTPLIALLLLPFFRRGWMVSTAARG